MNYKPTSKNRIDYPCSYMYFDVSDDFLSLYLDSRLSKIEIILQKKTTLDEFTCQYPDNLFNKMAKIFYPEKISENSQDERLCTRNFLCQFYRANLEKPNSEFNNNFKKLIQRFEVSKKIFDYYSLNLTKGDGSFRNYTLYINFAYCLLLGFNKSGNFQYLSSCLKVVDLILSLDDDEIFSITDKESIQNLVKLELFFVRNLTI